MIRVFGFDFSCPATFDEEYLIEEPQASSSSAGAARTLPNDEIILVNRLPKPPPKKRRKKKKKKQRKGKGDHEDPVGSDEEGKGSIDDEDAETIRQLFPTERKKAIDRHFFFLSTSGDAASAYVRCSSHIA